MTHKERIFTAARGEMPDILPYVPRIDLWYNANNRLGTLPERHRGRTQDEISRAEGWAMHHIVPEFLNVRSPEDKLHRALGLYSLREMVFRCKFSPSIRINVRRDDERTRVEYVTPIGTVSTVTSHTQEMKNSGASITWIEEHAIKRPEDYRVVGYLFENLELIPDAADFIKWRDNIGEDGIAATMVGLASSPMHHIQKEFFDATDFYYQYNDHKKEMAALAKSVENFFDQALQIIADSPAEAVLWGANFDDMITYPTYFRKEILPWIQKAADTLGSKGKVVICHCDGENLGLLDLIKESGMHVAEAICPHPMTKVRIEEYYRRWGDKLTIFGGIPSNILLAEVASEEEFEAYLDHLFMAIVPGRRVILGIADTTPPDAVFDRLVRIGQRVQEQGRLPLEAGSARPLTREMVDKAAASVAKELPTEETFASVQAAVLKGDHLGITNIVRALLDRGVPARDILNRGMIAAMEVIGEKFKTGDVFIPEVLLSARAMNEALVPLEKYLATDVEGGSGKILIGTVKGDLHDIGKNMVFTMLRGVGFEVRDLGINVPTQKFVQEVAEFKPGILGLSALLTTTMPEMRNVIDALKAAGLREGVKIMVGGAPVNAKFASAIGADGYGADAGEAVALARKLM